MSHTPNVPMDDAHLTKYAVNAARELKPRGKVPVRRLVRRLKRDLSILNRVQEELSEWSQRKAVLPPSVEWLLDNHYLAVREGEEALRALKKAGPLRGDGQGGALLQRCVRGGVWAVPHLERERLTWYLKAFQTVQPLTERELSLLVPVLAIELIQELAQEAGQLEELRQGRTDPGRLEHLFSALRALEGENWGPLLEEISRVEEILTQDPSGHYPHMDDRHQAALPPAGVPPGQKIPPGGEPDRP